MAAMEENNAADSSSDDEIEFYDAIESHSTDMLAKTLALRLAQETARARLNPAPQPPILQEPQSFSAKVIIDTDADVLRSPEYQAALKQVEATPGLVVNVGGETTQGIPRSRSASHLPNPRDDSRSPADLRVQSPRQIAEVTIEGDDGDAVTAARRKLLSVAQQVRSGGQYLLGAAGAKAARSRSGRSPSPRQRQRRPVGRLQVFVDHSNIYFGAWNSRNPSEQDRTVRIDVLRLVSEVERGRDVGNRKVIGASPDPSDPMWDDWRSRNYDVRVGMRTSLNTEQFVDDALHSEILRCLLAERRPQTLVLLSGDGNANNGACSFPWCCEEALKRKWNVEVYAWGQSISHEYRRLRSQYPDQMTIINLDSLCDLITYRQPRGAYIPGISSPRTPRMSDRSRSPTPTPGAGGGGGFRAMEEPRGRSPQRRSISSPNIAGQAGSSSSSKRRDPAVPPCWRGKKCDDVACKGAHPNGRAIDVPDYAPEAMAKPDTAPELSQGADSAPGSLSSLTLDDPRTRRRASNPECSPSPQGRSRSQSPRRRSRSPAQAKGFPDRRARTYVYAKCLKVLAEREADDFIAEHVQDGSISNVDEPLYIQQIDCLLNPLMMASRYGRERTVRYLLETCRADCNVADNNGNTALLYAAMNGHQGVVQLLLQHGARNDGRAADEALAQGHADLAELLGSTARRRSTPAVR